MKTLSLPRYHLQDSSWQATAAGQPRGYIQPESLSELWFHTGTACNLSCPFCLEGSHPGDHRLQQISLEGAKPFLDEAVEMGVETFSFTGGEPFINKDMVAILNYALGLRPCLVLSNGTKPLQKRLDEVLLLRHRPNPQRFRISLDYPDPARHDAARGAGNFQVALETLGQLHAAGFGVSIARLGEKDEDAAAVNSAYLPWFRAVGVPEETHIVVFPNFYTPGAHPAGVPEITEHCMTTYHTPESRARFMCNYSKMVVKHHGRMRVYACTLVDDDADYDLGGTLAEAMQYRVMLRHHRCFSCFACGASCSEGRG